MSRTGYWDEIIEKYPHIAKPSTISWCEPDYKVSFYVKEFQNTFTSLFIALGGLLGLYWSIKYRHQFSLHVFCSLIILVGVGSTLFHMTGIYIAQMLDELPMLTVMMTQYYILIQIFKKMYTVKSEWVNLQCQNAYNIARLSTISNNSLSASFNRDDTEPLLAPAERSVISLGGVHNSNDYQERDTVSVETVRDSDDFQRALNQQISPHRDMAQYQYLRQLFSSAPLFYIIQIISYIPILHNVLQLESTTVFLALTTIIVSVHSLLGFVIVFQVFFGMLTVSTALSCVEYCLQFTSGQERDIPVKLTISAEIDATQLNESDQEVTYNPIMGPTRNTLQRFRVWCVLYVFFFALAFSLWIIDNTFCSALTTKLPVYVSFHGLWHFFNYLTTYIGIILAHYGVEMAKNIAVDSVHAKKVISSLSSHRNADVEQDDLLSLNSNQHCDDKDDLDDNNFLLYKDLLSASNQGKDMQIISINLTLQYGHVHEVLLIPQPFITPCTPLVAIENRTENDL